MKCKFCNRKIDGLEVGGKTIWVHRDGLQDHVAKPLKETIDNAGERGNLVLSRCRGQSVVMECENGGPVISLTVVRIQNGQVQLAIAAPKSVRISRDNAKAGG